MVIDSVLTPWFVFCQLLPSLHLVVAISPLLSVISSLVTAASLLAQHAPRLGFCINSVVQPRQPFSDAVGLGGGCKQGNNDRSVGRRKLEPGPPRTGCSKAELGPHGPPLPGNSLWFLWTHRQRARGSVLHHLIPACAPSLISQNEKLYTPATSDCLLIIPFCAPEPLFMPFPCLCALPHHLFSTWKTPIHLSRPDSNTTTSQKPFLASPYLSQLKTDLNLLSTGLLQLFISK